MTIQINQEFPHCARCGIMLHSSQGRFAGFSADGKSVVLCTPICRDEYADLYGFADAVVWVEGSAASQGRAA